MSGITSMADTCDTLVDGAVYSPDPPRISNPRLDHLSSPDPEEIHRITEGRVTVKYPSPDHPIWILSPIATPKDSELFVEYMAKFHPPPDRTAIAVSYRTGYLRSLLSEDSTDERNTNIRAVLTAYASGTLPKQESPDWQAIFFQRGEIVQPPIDHTIGSVWCEPAKLNLQFNLMNASAIPSALPPGSQIYQQPADSTMARINTQIRLPHQQGGNGNHLDICIYNDSGSDVVTICPHEAASLG